MAPLPLEIPQVLRLKLNLSWQWKRRLHLRYLEISTRLVGRWMVVEAVRRAAQWLYDYKPVVEATETNKCTETPIRAAQDRSHSDHHNTGTVYLTYAWLGKLTAIQNLS